MRSASRIVRPARTLAPIASSALSASFGNCVEKVRRDTGLNRRQKASSAAGQEPIASHMNPCVFAAGEKQSRGIPVCAGGLPQFARFESMLPGNLFAKHTHYKPFEWKRKYEKYQLYKYHGGQVECGMSTELWFLKRRVRTREF